MKKIKDKSKLSDYQKEKLQGLESRSGNELKQDVGLTDKKGDNFDRDLEKKDDLKGRGDIHGKKGPRR